MTEFANNTGHYFEVPGLLENRFINSCSESIVQANSSANIQKTLEIRAKLYGDINDIIERVKLEARQYFEHLFRRLEYSLSHMKVTPKIAKEVPVCIYFRDICFVVRHDLEMSKLQVLIDNDIYTDVDNWNGQELPFICRTHVIPLVYLSQAEIQLLKRTQYKIADELFTQFFFKFLNFNFYESIPVCSTLLELKQYIKEDKSNDLLAITPYVPFCHQYYGPKFDSSMDLEHTINTYDHQFDKMLADRKNPEQVMRRSYEIMREIQIAKDFNDQDELDRLLLEMHNLNQDQARTNIFLQNFIRLGNYTEIFKQFKLQKFEMNEIINECFRYNDRLVNKEDLRRNKPFGMYCALSQERMRAAEKIDNSSNNNNNNTSVNDSIQTPTTAPIIFCSTCGCQHIEGIHLLKLNRSLDTIMDVERYYLTPRMIGRARKWYSKRKVTHMLSRPDIVDRLVSKKSCRPSRRNRTYTL